MPIISEEFHLIIKDCLKEMNCCNRCILKYLGYQCFEDGWDIFLEPRSYSLFSDEENEAKKVKPNPCRACLDILNDSTMECYLENLPKCFEEYKMDNFTTFLTLPISISIRERSMFIFLKEKFPQAFTNFTFSSIQNTKSIFKMASSNMFTRKLNKVFCKVANFQINVNIKYEDEMKETQNVCNIESKKISRVTVADALDNCTDEVFKKHFPVPPNIQDKNTFATISYSSSILFLGGRYLKFSREMGQSPFIVNEKFITESSVQDTLFESICKVLGCEQQNLKFSASGREDADTRMIGGGRPFYIQIDNPKFEKITYEQCRNVEALILNSNTVIAKNLQMVTLSKTKLVKFGEQEKKKHYRALCKTTSPNVKVVVNTINLLKGPLKIHQATPIRVLHRRTQMIRDKYIYKIQATEVEGHVGLFYLDLITQAGTYVKEFVHGDFNRTNPNISKYVKYATDVVALDVTDVDLDWPPNVYDT